MCDTLTSPLYQLQVLNVHSLSVVIDISSLHTRYTLTVKYCPCVIGIENLPRLRDLTFAHLQQIELNCCSVNNVEPLKKIPHIKLINCCSLSNTAIANAKSLDLSYCIKIADVSMLGNVRELSLEACYRVRIDYILCSTTMHLFVYYRLQMLVCSVTYFS